MPTEREVIENCACYRIRTAARVVTRAYDEALRPVGLRATQLSVLTRRSRGGRHVDHSASEVYGHGPQHFDLELCPLEKEGLITLGDEVGAEAAPWRLRRRDDHDFARHCLSGNRANRR